MFYIGNRNYRVEGFYALSLISRKAIGNFLNSVRLLVSLYSIRLQEVTSRDYCSRDSYKRKNTF